MELCTTRPDNAKGGNSWNGAVQTGIEETPVKDPKKGFELCRQGGH